ncbi:hypothetical protein PoB_005410200 [Plakobranchus ocellatus]|uniref:Uncharacterized protein n=1 Tax=Plakobranchus ocellatus TaxID=259542 RepID=A0AAV4C7V6_9GAST|nr:hypothetical protein PoB_005410200 [Plakobranchus ocellatus]
MGSGGNGSIVLALRTVHKLRLALQVLEKNSRFSAARSISYTQTNSLELGYRKSSTNTNFIAVVTLPKALMQLDETDSVCIDLYIPTLQYTVARLNMACQMWGEDKGISKIFLACHSDQGNHIHMTMSRPTNLTWRSESRLIPWGRY